MFFYLFLFIIVSFSSSSVGVAGVDVGFVIVAAPAVPTAAPATTYRRFRLCCVGIISARKQRSHHPRIPRSYPSLLHVCIIYLRAEAKIREFSTDRKTKNVERIYIYISLFLFLLITYCAVRRHEGSGGVAVLWALGEGVDCARSVAKVFIIPSVVRVRVRVRVGLASPKKISPLSGCWRGGRKSRSMAHERSQGDDIYRHIL